MLFYSALLQANPQDPIVLHGDINIAYVDQVATIQQNSPQAIINWESFNIEHNETTRFIQTPDAIILNRINPQHGPSNIHGKLDATGTIVLVNPAGVFIGKDASVDVAGIIASTADITNENFLQNRLHFNIPGKCDAQIINQGNMQAHEHGLVALIGPTVRNDGLIHAKLGKVILASSQDTIIDMNGDDLITFGVPCIAGEGVSNTGEIYANGGEVLLTTNAAEGILDLAINMQGLIHADTLDDINGKIVIYGGEHGSVNVTGDVLAVGSKEYTTGGSIRITAADGVNISDNALIDVSGAAGGGEVLIGGFYQGQNKEHLDAKQFYLKSEFKSKSILLEDPSKFSVGKYKNSKKTLVDAAVNIKADALHSGCAGTIVLWSDEIGAYMPTISAAGLSEHALGGFVEASAKNLYAIPTKVDLRGANGSVGELLLDPAFLNVQTAGGSPYSAGANNLFANNVGGTNILTPASIVAAAVGANITLQANTDVTITDPLAITTSARTLTVQAGRSILINSATSTTNGAILLSANDTAATSADRAAGAGNITMTGSTVSAGTAGLTMTIGTSAVAPFTPGSITALGLTGGAIALSTPNALTATTIACTSLSVDVGATSSINGIISGAAATLTKIGAGLLDLTAANTYGGLTTVSVGTLRASNAAATGSTAGGVTVTSGATFEINGVAIGAESLTLNGAGVGGNGALIGTGTCSLSGAIALASNTTIGGTGTMTLSGIMSGAFNLIKIGSGTISLSGANTYSGTTTVSAGTLRASNATGLGAVGSAATVAAGATLDINAVTVGAKPLNIQGTGVGGAGALTGTGTATYGGAITMAADTTISGTGTLTLSGIISGAFNLTKDGTGTVSLSGANTYSGTTFVSAGTLRASNASGLGSIASAITVSPGAALDVNAVAVGAKPLSISGTGIGGIGALTGTGTGSYAGAITLLGDTTVGGAGALTLSGIVGGAFNLTKVGTGSVTLSGVNTFSGTTLVSAGTLQANNASALGSNASTITVSSGAALSINAVAIGAKPLSIAGTGIGGTGALITTGTCSYAGAITLTADTTIGGTGSTATISGSIGGGFNLTKVGTSIYILSTANTYTGSTIINAGTLRVSADNRLGTAPGAFTANNIRLGGGTLNATAAFTINPNRGITLTANSTIQSDVSTLVYGGVIAGSGFGFTKTGAGIFQLAGVNTFTGPVTISTGVLNFTQANAIANCSTLTTANTAGVSLQLNGTDQTIGSLSGGGTTGGGIVLGANTLSINQTAATTYAGAITGTGNILLTNASTNTLTLSSTTSTYSGITTVNGGAILITADSNLGAAPGVVTPGKLVLSGGTVIANATFTLNANRGILLNSGGGIVQVNPGFTLTYNGIIAGTGDMTKTGTGSLTSSGVHTYSGVTNINNGTVTLGVANALANSSSINFANVNGANLNCNGFAQSIQNLSGGGTTGGLLILGAANLSISEVADTTFAGEFSGSGDITLGNTSTNTLSLTNTSTGFTGNFNLNGGVLALNADGNLGAAPGSPTLGKINFDGGTLRSTVDLTINANRGINIATGGATFLTDANTVMTYNGNIVGSVGALSKAGSGTLSLGGANTYSSATNVTSGVLQISSTNGLGATASVTVTNGASLDVSFNSSTLANTNQITLNGNGFSGQGALFVSGSLVTINNPINVATASLIAGSGSGTMSFGGTVSGNANTTFSFPNAALALPIINQTIGDLSVTASTGITQNGAITISPGNATFSGATANTDVTLNAANDFSSNAVLFTGTTSNIRDVYVRDINVAATAPTVSTLSNLRNYTLEFNNAAISLPAVTLNNSGSMVITAGGAIAQTGVLNIPGTSSFTTGNFPITLNQNNLFNGAVTLVNTGNNDVTLQNATGLVLGGSSIGRNIIVTATGPISQTGAITVPGTAGFTAGSNSIVLSQNNSFTGAVSLSNSGANDVSIKTTGALSLGTVSVGQDLSLTSGGNITQISTINASGGLTTISSTVPNTDVNLMLANNFDGFPITFTGTRANIRDVSLRNVNSSAATPILTNLTSLRNLTLQHDNAGIIFSTVTLHSGGNLSAIAGGAITQTGIITVPGTTNINAGAFPITLSQGNSLAGAITVQNSGTNDVSITNTTNTILSASTVGQNLTISTTGAITQTGILVVPGNSSFSSGNFPITLSLNNLFTGELSFANTGANNVAVTNSLATVLDTINIGQNLSVAAGGNITQSGPITMTNGTLNMSITSPVSSILLTENNNFGTFAPVISGTQSNIVNLNIKNVSTNAGMPLLSGLTNLHYLELTFPNSNIPLASLNMNGTAILAANNITGDLNVHGLQLNSNFCNLTGFVNGLAGQSAIDQIVLLNTITAGTHFFDGIDMYGTTPPPTPPVPNGGINISEATQILINNVLFTANNYWQDMQPNTLMAQYYSARDEYNALDDAEQEECVLYGEDIQVCM